MPQERQRGFCNRFSKNRGERKRPLPGPMKRKKHHERKKQVGGAGGGATTARGHVETEGEKHKTDETTFLKKRFSQEKKKNMPPFKAPYKSCDVALQKKQAVHGGWEGRSLQR